MKTLLLNSSYEPISFISERRLIRLLFKNKVDVICNSNHFITWASGKIPHPSVIKLRIYISRNFSSVKFSRQVLVKRDNSTCQYCSKKLLQSETTIDHIIPKSFGGKTNFINCVVSCTTCNGYKANRTPSEANMVLLKQPIHPPKHFELISQVNWDDSWNEFLQR